MRQIYQRFPFLKTIRIKQFQKQSIKLQTNRKKVLSGYRFLLKSIPYIYDRPLKQAQMQGELHHLFHKAQIIVSQQQADGRVAHMQKIINEIRQKDYSSLGSYVIGYQNYSIDMKSFTSRSVSSVFQNFNFSKKFRR